MLSHGLEATKMSAKQAILYAMEQLHMEYPSKIANPSYRGSMKIYPHWKVSVVAKRAGCSEGTVRSWMHKLPEISYGNPNRWETFYYIWRTDLPPVQLHF